LGLYFKPRQFVVLVLAFFLLSASRFSYATSYLSRSDFVELVKQQLIDSQIEFNTTAIGKNHQRSDLKLSSHTLWLNKSLQESIRLLIGHPYPKLRLRYKIIYSSEKPTTIWYLDEIGKERPISFAVSVRDAKIQLIRVLDFRESRGHEIHLQTFADQFSQNNVNSDGDFEHSIDGITGATMSVRAMKKMARLALMLHSKALPTINKDESKS